MKIEKVKLEDVIELFKSMIHSSILIPVIGAGFSCGYQAKNGRVPNGTEMKKEMIARLKELDESKNENFEQKTFQQIARYYNYCISAKNRKKYLLNYFTQVKLPANLVNFLELPWQYIYTLNIDDAIEKNSDFDVIEPNRELDSTIKEYTRVVFKMHGDAKNMAYLAEGEAFSVFDTDQYIESLEQNKSILTQLKQDYIDKNLLFLGCSLQDELDLLHVFSKVKNEGNYGKVERFYITDKQLSSLQLIDLEKYGITKVVYIKSYEDFYDNFYQIKEDLMCARNEDLLQFKNIPIEILDSYDDKNKSYVLNGKNPFDKKAGKIYLPYFFIERKITTQVLENFNKYPLQIIYGKRISGKSYVLLDILHKVRDCDRYYFDSRERISRKNLEYLFKKKNSLIVIDTNVLRDEDLNYILKYNLKELRDNNIKIVIAVNVSKKTEAHALNSANNNQLIAMYYLENKFIADNEHKPLINKMAACNLLYFDSNKTILDNLILMQEKIGKQNKLPLNDFRVQTDNFLHIAYLLLLANYGKVTSADLVKFSFNAEPYELMPKLDYAVEEDFSYMITSSIYDRSYYQIVCNAQGWLLGYLSKIALKNDYKNSIIEAFNYVICKLNEESDFDKVKTKKLFKFIMFDNINMLLGGIHRRGTSLALRNLIQKIYARVKPILSCEYQFNHQHAKCLLWAIETAPKDEQDKDLEQALRSINLCLQQIQDGLNKNPQNQWLNTSLAHAQFTLAIIQVKNFYLNQTLDNFKKAVKQFEKALNYPENVNAQELYEDSTDDEKDYSLSQFMDSIVEGKWKDFSSDINREIKKIIDFRTQKFYRH